MKVGKLSKKLVGVIGDIVNNFYLNKFYLKLNLNIKIPLLNLIINSNNNIYLLKIIINLNNKIYKF